MPDYWNIARITGAVILPNIGGLASSTITRNAIKDWYSKLNFPSFRPPNWLFAPVWTALYCGIGYASYLVWRDGGGFRKAAIPLGLYGLQLALNWAWTPIFFGAHNIKGGLIDIVALTATASATGILFWEVNKVAGGLFIPYIGWLSFATVLNYSMLKLNPDAKALEDGKQLTTEPATSDIINQNTGQP